MGGSKNNDEQSLLEAIKFYQSGLIRYLQRNDEFKMSHGLNKLSSYPIRLSHLQDTGVGRTVNLLVNKEGKVGEQARSLIEKWKKMVEKEEQKQKLDSCNRSSHSSPQSSGEESSEKRSSSSEKSCSDKNNSSDEEQHSSSESQRQRKIENNSESAESTSDEDRKHNSRKDKRHRSSHDSGEVTPKKHRSKEKDHSRHGKEHSSSHGKDVSSRHSSQYEKKHSSRKENEHSSQTSKHNDKEHSSHRRKEYSSKHDKKERNETEKSHDDGTKKRDGKSHREKERVHHEKNDKSRNKEKSDTDRSKTHQEKHERQKQEHDKSVTKGKEVAHKVKEGMTKDEDKKSSSGKSKDEKKSSNKYYNTEISSGSGTSFEEALGFMEMPRKEKKSHSKEASDSAYRKSESSKSSSDNSKTSKSNKENKSDKKSNSKHDDTSKSEKRKPKNYEKSSSSKHNTEEKTSGSGTSFENALGKMDIPKKDRKQKRKAEIESNIGCVDSEICSSSGTTFEEALGMIEMPRKKKKLSEQTVVRSPSPVENEPATVPLPKVPLDKIELTSYLPPITPNYKPIRLPESQHTHNDTTFMDTLMKNKYHRTKIYSGNRSAFNKVPTLLESCINLLKIHIDDIEATGGVPYSILKPVLEKATPTQLLRLEYYNSYLTEDTDELWKLHCQKDFRNKTRQECETWREMYTRCTEEREARFLTLTASIKESKQKSLPVRTTKVAYIVPPMSGPRRLSKNTAAPMAKAKAEAITRDSMSASDVIVNHQRKASRSQPVASVTSQSKVKKMAPLMAKSLSAFKNRRYK